MTATQTWVLIGLVTSAGIFLGYGLGLLEHGKSSYQRRTSWIAIVTGILLIILPLAILGPLIQ